MRSVYVAIPSHSGSVTVGTFMSIIQTIVDMGDLGVNVIVQTWTGDSLIGHARDALAAMFMTTDCTDLVFIDADVAWDSDAFARLLMHDVEFVCGLYPYKNDDEGYPFNIIAGTKEFWSINPVTGEPSEPGVINISASPMGFTRIARSAVEKMREARKHKRYRQKNCPEICYLLFDTPFIDPANPDDLGVRPGEDYANCALWTELGGKVWVDPEIKLTHIGMKGWKGDFGAWLRNRNKPSPELEKMREVFGRDGGYDQLFNDALGIAAE